MPVKAGSKIAKMQYFILPVSFFMVSNVVVQGQWKSEKSETESAVKKSQPLFIKISVKKELFVLLREEEPIYIISTIGSTISFAVLPRIKAKRIIPSIARSLAKGSKKSAQIMSREFPFINVFAPIQSNAPAGIAT